MSFVSVPISPQLPCILQQNGILIFVFAEIGTTAVCSLSLLASGDDGGQNEEEKKIQTLSTHTPTPIPLAHILCIYVIISIPLLFLPPSVDVKCVKIVCGGEELVG